MTWFLIVIAYVGVGLLLAQWVLTASNRAIEIRMLEAADMLLKWPLILLRAGALSIVLYMAVKIAKKESERE